MVNKYLFRGLNAEEARISGLHTLKKHSGNKDFDVKNLISDFFYNDSKPSEVTGMSSSLSVAMYYSKTNKDKNYNGIIAVNVNSLKRLSPESILIDFSTMHMFREFSMHSCNDFYRDDHHETLSDRSREYVCVGDIPKEAYMYIPRFLVEIIHYMIYEHEKNYNFSYFNLQIPTSLFNVNYHKKDVRDIFYTMGNKYLYGSYKNPNDLLDKNGFYEENKVLSDYTLRLSEPQKEDFKKEIDKIDNCEQNEVFFARALSDLLLDSYAEHSNKLFGDSSRSILSQLSGIEKLFIFEYFYCKKSMKSILGIFKTEKFLNNYDNVVETSIILESIRCSVLKKIILCFLTSEILIDEEKKLLKLYYDRIMKNMIIIKYKYFDAVEFPIDYSIFLPHCYERMKSRCFCFYENMSLDPAQKIRNIEEIRFSETIINECGIYVNKIFKRKHKREGFFARYNDDLISSYISKQQSMHTQNNLGEALVLEMLNYNHH